VKLLTELTTLDAFLATGAIWAAEGLGGSAVSALWSAATDDFTALVWLGKSLLAELTSEVASLWIFVTCDLRALVSPLVAALETAPVSPLTEFSRLLRSEQYAGLLLLPQPATATSATATSSITGRRNQVRRGPSRELSRLMRSSDCRTQSTPS
jgi:hypothetical protein